MSKTLKRLQREQRQLRENGRKKVLYKREEEMDFGERLQHCADDANKALEYLFEEKLVRVSIGDVSLLIDGEDKKSYVLLMFPSSVWKYADKKLQVKTKEGA